MRQNQKSNRMRNRPRKGGGNNGATPGNNLNRSYESNGPDVKVRGTPHHIAEKYQQLARDATSSGDRVAAENYYQHAEHYLRIIAAAQASQAEFQERRRLEDERRREEEERWRENQERRRQEDERRRMERQGQERGGAERQDRDDRYRDDRERNGQDRNGQDRGQDWNGHERGGYEAAEMRDRDAGSRVNADGRRDRGAQQGRGEDRPDERGEDRPRRRRRVNGSVDEAAMQSGSPGAEVDAPVPSDTQQPDPTPTSAPPSAETAPADMIEDAPKPRRRRTRKAAEAVDAAAVSDMPDGQSIAHALPGAPPPAEAASGGDASQEDAPKPRRRRAAPRRKAEASDAPDAALTAGEA